MASPVILDTTVLSNFAHVQRPDLVYLLWPNLTRTTPAAMEEYAAGVRSGAVPPDIWRDLELVELTPEEDRLALSLAPGLGRGERICLAVAIERKAILVTDDRRARQLASALGVQTTGTIGILLGCIREGLIALEEANGLLQRMIDRGYRAPTLDLRRYLK